VIDIEQVLFDAPDKVSQVTYAHADLIWSEYIATKLSRRSKPENDDLYVESLLSLILETKEQCEKVIIAYHSTGDIDQLFCEIQLTKSLLLKVITYFIGYFHSYNIEPPNEMNSFFRKYSYLDGV
jgi:hypothetical protein